MMSDAELKDAIVQYIKEYYERYKEVPPLRKMFKHFKKEKLDFPRFYEIFPGRISEACSLAAVPIPTERIRQTEKATEASRMRRKQEKDLSEVEDERVKEVLDKTMGWKKERDKAKALVEAREQETKTRLEALKYEAQLDSRKIPAYLEAVDSPLSGGLLRDLQEACKLERVSLKEGCSEAVEDWGRSARTETKTFEDYVEYCLSNWTWLVRLIKAMNKYSRMSSDCRCSECNVEYEYSTCPPSDFKCPNCGKTVYYECPVCREAWRSEERLEYDPKTNKLHCSSCGTHFDVAPPALNGQGTDYLKKGEQQRRARADATKQHEEQMKKSRDSLAHARAILKLKCV